MYSVVLATMMSVGGEAPQQLFRRCHCSCSCSCHGCWGWRHACSCSCHGCYGSFGHGCHGCWGCSCSCSCHGCHGAVVYHVACHGCSGCSCFGCHGCTGVVAHANPVPRPTGGDPSVTPQSDAEREAVRRYLEQLRRKTAAPATENTTSTPAARDFAIVDVRMPAGAKLFIDSTPFPINSTENRTFRTPSLQEGQQYFYILRAEMERDGQTVVQNQRVQLTAGQRLNVQFNMDSLQTVQR